MFNRKKKRIKEIEESFGKVKEQYFHFASIEKYFRHRPDQQGTHVISDRTCNDLDFDEFFRFLDRTSSKVGQQYLYNRLRRHSKEIPSFEIQERLIAKLHADPKLRLEVQLLLSKLDKGSGAYHIASLFQEELLHPPKWIHLIEFLSATSIFLTLLAPFYPVLVLVLIGIFSINLGIHLWNKKHVHFYLESIPELITMNAIAKKLLSLELSEEESENVTSSITSINKIRRKMSFFQLDRATEGDFAIIAYAIFESIKVMFLLEPVFLFRVLKRIEMISKDIENVFTYVGTIDVAISILSLRQGLDQWCFPNFLNQESSIRAEGIFHPLLPNCVGNSIDNNGRSILLTGSNMSGKTTFIRTIGLNSITANSTNTCFAHSFETSPFSLHSAVRISDDLMNSKSYYLEEVVTIKSMIDASEGSSSSLFLLDEIFKGTNTVERIAAGKAVLSALNKEGNLVFVSTHDIELADLLAEEYDCYHFSEIVDKSTVDFDYKIKNGKLTTRNAIKILEVNDYTESITKEARKIAENLDKKN